MGSGRRWRTAAYSRAAGETVLGGPYAIMRCEPGVGVEQLTTHVQHGELHD